MSAGLLAWLDDLRRLGVHLSARDDRLSVRAPEGVLTDALRQEITERKAELLALLASPDASGGPIRPRHPRPDRLPLSFAQQRLWFLDQLTPDNPFYTVPIPLRLTGDLSLPALEAALNGVVRRHEALRTTFSLDGGRPFQRIAPRLTIPLTFTDLSGLASAERDADTRRWQEAAARHRFDLERGPLLDARLLRLAERDHLLLLTLHHIVADGWSLGVLFRELAALYDAARTGQDTALPNLPVQYADFALWQREHLAEAALAGQRAYWAKRLAGLPTLDLLPDYPRPAVQTFAGGRTTRLLPAALLARLHDLSRSAGVSLYMTLLAAFALLLARRTHCEDIVVGSPIANRNRSEIEPLIGFFVNTLVLRVEVSDNPTVRDLLARVRDVTLGAFAHQDVPFEQIVQDLRPERDLSRHPLTQIVFAHQNAPLELDTWPGLEVRLAEANIATTRYDLEVNAWEEAEGLKLDALFASDLFTAGTIEDLLGHLETILEAFAGDPGQHVVEMALGGKTPVAHPLPAKVTGGQAPGSGFGADSGGQPAAGESVGRERAPTAEKNGAEQRQASGAVIANERESRRPVALATGGIHQLVEARAAEKPDAVAVSGEGTRLTFGDLNRRANRVARALRARGAGPERIVGICLDRTPDLIVGMLGVLKAGAAYLPLDPRYPDDHVAGLLADAEVRLLVTQANLGDRVPEWGGDRVAIDGPEAPYLLEKSGDSIPIDLGISAGQPESNLDLPARPDGLAYVIYTSGSTGRPKGVMVTHANVARLLAATAPWFGFGPDDVWSVFHSASFDFSVWEIWGALTTGGRAVIVPYWVSRSPRDFYALLADEAVTVLNQTPSAFRQLLPVAATWSGTRPPLRYVVFGGEALDPELLWPWIERPGSERPRLVNMYGITETTVHVTYHPVTPADLEGAIAGRSPIGVAIPDLTVHILDRGGYPVPPGFPGELHIGGAGLARGYLGRPALTAERFIPDPFSLDPGARLYRTGDLGRCRSDGTIEFLGRIDQQIKVRGFRIEPGEIEAALRRLPDVQDAVVLLRTDATGEPRLVAYVVPRDDAPLTGLRAELRTLLPEHLVPSAFVRLPALPLTENGKLDQTALPDVAAESEERPARVPPGTPVEETLAGIWGGVLGVSEASIYDNFFDLGGDSIRSMQVIAAANAAGLPISVQQLFQTPTIAELAVLVERQETPGVKFPPRAREGAVVEEVDSSSTPHSTPTEDSYALARLQAGMLFHGAYAASSPLYHDIASYHLAAPYHPAALRAALDDLAARHPILRTSFNLSDFDEPVQVVHPDATIPLELEDISSLSDGEQRAVVDRWMEAERQRPIDWRVPPLLRVQVHRRSPARLQLGLSLHHAILDGWSVATLLTELLQTYLARLNPGVPAPAAPATTYRDFIALEQAALAREDFRAFWTGYLHDYPVTQIPPPEVPGASARDLVLPIADEITAGLHRVAREAGVPLRTVLLAAHLRVISFISGAAEVVTGLVTHGRPETPDSDRALGLFLNTLPFRLRLAGGAWIDLIREIWDAELALLPYRRYPLAEIQRALGGKRLFETAFNYTHFHIANRLNDLPGVEVLDVTGFQETEVPLSVNASLGAGSGELRLVVSSAEGALGTAQLDRVGGYLLATLEAIAWDPAARYETDHLLGEEEARAVLAAGRGPAISRPAGGIHQAVAEQAARTPDSPALQTGDRRLTYAELDARANRVAHALIERGIRPGMVAGLCVERSFDLIAGLLGILKAGAVYLPLDPTHPPERLRGLLEDAQPAILLTHERHLDALAPFAGNVLCFDRDAAELDAAPAGDPSVPVASHWPAYIIFTSGSTGRPKGVVAEHGALLNIVLGHHEAVDVRPSDRVFQSFTSVFDASIVEIFHTLVAGACLYLPAWEETLPGPGLVAALRDREITVITLVPSVLTALPDADLPALRTLVVGGEPCPEAIVRRWGAGLRFINAYGPTEATIGVTWDEVSPDDPRVTIGRPFPNVEVYLLDRHLHLVPRGTPGEVFIGGAGVAPGYLNRPGQTAERFVPHPFSQEPGARLYRTGDLARFHPDGRIEFLGRIDNQVKVRGFRVEIGEVEATLKVQAGVQDAAVAARPGADGQNRLAAYLVPRPGHALIPHEVRNALQRLMPDYLVPATFTILDALPLTPNGKLDRAALPEPAAQPATNGEERAAPRTPVEGTLVAIWEQVLRVAPVGVHDNYFELGGDSILSIQIVSRATEAGLRILPQDIFRHPTIAELAAVAAPSIPAPEAATPAGPFPLTPIQEWFLARQSPEPNHFNQALLLEVRPDVAPEHLAWASAALVEHHEALRLRLRSAGASFEQMVNSVETPDDLYSTIDLSKLPAAEQNTALETAAAAAQRSLNLEAGPIFRAVRIDLGAERGCRLLLVAHHWAVDAVSWRILLEDLATALAQIERDEPVRLPRKTAAYRVWAEHLVGLAQSEEARSEAAYWHTLAEPADLPLPRDIPALGTVTEASARTITSALTLGETDALLRQVPAAYGTQINDLLLTALARLFHEWTGRPETVVDLEGHGREDPTETLDLSRTVGWFTALYPVRLAAGDLERPGEALKAMKEALRRIPRHGIGYGVLRYLGEENIPDIRPDVAFNYLGQGDALFPPDSPFQPAAEPSGPAWSPLLPRAHAFEVMALVLDGRLRVNWNYSDQLHRLETVEWLADGYLRYLRALIEHCLSPGAGGYTPSDFPLADLTQAELEALTASITRGDGS